MQRMSVARDAACEKAVATEQLLRKVEMARDAVLDAVVNWLEDLQPESVVADRKVRVVRVAPEFEGAVDVAGNFDKEDACVLGEVSVGVHDLFCKVGNDGCMAACLCVDGQTCLLITIVAAIFSRQASNKASSS